jgi:hypothetical protein
MRHIRQEEAKKNWRKINGEGLHNLYSSPYIRRVVRSGTILYVVHVAGMGEKNCACKNVMGKHKVKRELGRPGSRGEVLLKWTLT